MPPPSAVRPPYSIPDNELFVTAVFVRTAVVSLLLNIRMPPPWVLAWLPETFDSVSDNRPP